MCVEYLASAVVASHGYSNKQYHSATVASWKKYVGIYVVFMLHLVCLLLVLLSLHLLFVRDRGRSHSGMPSRTSEETALMKIRSLEIHRMARKIALDHPLSAKNWIPAASVNQLRYQKRSTSRQSPVSSRNSRRAERVEIRSRLSTLWRRHLQDLVSGSLVNAHWILRC